MYITATKIMRRFRKRPPERWEPTAKPATGISMCTTAGRSQAAALQAGSSSPPFDGAGEVFKKTNGAYEVDDEGLLVPKTDVKLAGNTTLNHYFGMTMETLFLQPEDGKIDADTPMSFSFSGDDDVWIFIDDVLVSDLGGIHDECFTVIDFESGMVNTGLTPTIRNSDGSFTEDIPTLEELKTGTPEQGGGTWYNRSSKQPA